MHGTWQLAADEIRKRTSRKIFAGIVLGSGLGNLPETFSAETQIAYRDLPGFPVPSVAAHAGNLLIGLWSGVPVAVLQGRVHYYEGFSPEETVFPIRVLKALGAEAVLLTNCSGAINPLFQPGDLALVTDHVSFFVPSPLRGANDGELGPRYPEMSGSYDARLNQRLRQAAAEEGILLREGVYVQTPGPQLETPAEIRFCARCGADLVGMSTVPEVIAARHCGLRCAAVSCVANMAAGIAGKPLSIDEIYAVMGECVPKLQRLLSATLRKIGSAQGSCSL